MNSRILVHNILRCENGLLVPAGLRAAGGSAMLVFITSPVRVVVRTLASFVSGEVGDQNLPSIACHALERPPTRDNSVQPAGCNSSSSQTSRPEECSRIGPGERPAHREKPRERRSIAPLWGQRLRQARSAASRLWGEGREMARRRKNNSRHGVQKQPQGALASPAES